MCLARRAALVSQTSAVLLSALVAAASSVFHETRTGSNLVSAAADHIHNKDGASL